MSVFTLRGDSFCDGRHQTACGKMLNGDCFLCAKAVPFKATQSDDFLLYVNDAEYI